MPNPDRIAAIGHQYAKPPSVHVHRHKEQPHTQSSP